jgi:LmbE family N-acetylglucosaminyl deacetylase
MFVMKHFILLFLFFALKPSSLSAQHLTTNHCSHILHQLQKLNTLGSILYIAAHPDDENTRLLSYLANEKKFRTAYLSLTRGDGGQNLIGKEQGDMLGLIRTQELLAARRVDGAEQFFTRANDFGYSKTPEESLNFWNKDSILKDMVLIIRRFKPDVIICRFPTTGEGGHGHHTASAILALEAFDAAANPKRFPEQLQELQVWQSKRIFWNTFNFGGTNTTAPDQLQTDVGLYNPLLGKNYGEIAAESRTCHKSQGFGTSRQRGSNIEYFKLLKGDAVKTDVFEGITSGWSRIKGAENIQKLINTCIKQFNPSQPELSLKTLSSIYKLLSENKSTDDNEQYWIRQKQKEVQHLIESCSGLFAEGNATDFSAVPGQSISYSASIIARMNSGIRLHKIILPNGTDSTTALALKTNSLYVFKYQNTIPKETAYSNPYWLNDTYSNGLYTVKNTEWIGKPQNDAPLHVKFVVSVNTVTFAVERELTYKYTDPVKGELYRPLEILPPATVHLPEKAFVFSGITPTKTISVLIKANSSNVQGKLLLESTGNFSVTLKQSEFTLKNKGDELLLEAEITSPASASSGKLNAELLINNNRYKQSISRIEYDHIPYQFVLKPAEALLINCNLQKAGTEIGYIPGAGDDVMACLKQIGYNVTLLDDDFLTKGDLSKFNAIVTGVRAYNANERLQVHYNKLMDYVKNGGNLLVQYNTNNRIGPVKANIAPYPFTISRNRVTDEKAEVKFLNANHPALKSPNNISAEDFNNWIQERGIYFADELSKEYETLLSMNDKDEKENSGALIVAKHGKGNFVYTGLAFFRQLPAGVTGAYRLFANLLSLPKNN